MKITKTMIDLARKSGACKEALTWLEQNPDGDIETIRYEWKCWIAKNPNAPFEILEFLSKDQNWLVRFNVAGNPSTPKEVIQILSDDLDSHVRWNVVLTSGREILDVLAKDSVSFVRESAFQRIHSI